MNTYEVKEYSAFSDAISSTDTLTNSIKNLVDALQKAKATISDTGVFMGPVQEQCMQIFASIEASISEMTQNYSSLSSLLSQTDQNYQSADQQAANAVLGTTASSAASMSSTQAISSGSMISYNYEGKNFNMVNTKLPVSTYEQYLQKNGVNQNSGLCPSDCMLLSQYYAKDLLTGKYTHKSTMAAGQGGPAVRMNERCRSTNPQDVLNYTYNELNEGHPVVLQVSQIHSDKGWRHLVTAVGYDSSVQSAKDLNPNTILVLDCVDGKIQTLGKARSEGGHERRLFAQGGNYQALGPTKEFLAKEVNTGTTTVTA